MGCITSREKWPPDPPKRTIVLWERKMVMDGGRWVAKVVPREEVITDWPSLKCAGSSISASDDSSVLQSNAIRHLEGE